MENNTSLLKGDTVIDVQKLIGLEQSIASRDQLIGIKTEQASGLKQQIADLKKEHESQLEKSQKEVRIVTGKSDANIHCDSCGWHYNTLRYGSCPSCGYRNSRVGAYQYKNLDDVVEMIRKEEGKNLKLDVNALEQTVQDLELKNENLKKEKDRIHVKWNTSIQEQGDEVRKVKSELRERHQEELAKSEKRITSLIDEIKKIKNDKTDELVELNRKKEIVELKARISELEKEIDQIEQTKVGPFSIKGWWNDKKADKLKKEAIAEKEERQETIEKISNEYPKNKSFWNFFNYPWGPESDPYKSEEEEGTISIGRRVRNWFF